ncbi:MAG: 30S ribosomal protein S9 [Endomicrobium sp.]|jgi:small subunit ribosomal protein S9|nr:30S ribosomal protein S9 [Endomicrobium sp.]
MNNVLYLATGRRKTAVSRVKVLAGSGKVMVNDRTVSEYFGGLERLRKAALNPMSIWEGVRSYDFYINANGGGVSGQAGAISHSLARVILKLNESSKSALKKAGFLTRDSRMVERKKSGRPKARKRFQFSKR